MKTGEFYLVDEVHRELEREDMLQLIKQELKKNPHIISVFYEQLTRGGHETEIHLHAVVQPAFYQEMLQHKRSIASTFGKVLFYEEKYEHYDTIIAHYENLLKLVLTFHHPKLLQPTVNYKQIEILDDEYGVMGYIQQQSQTLNYHFSFEELDHWRTKFFAHYYDFHRSIQLSETYQANHCLDVMRWLIATIWMVEGGRRANAYLEWSYMEGNDSVLSVEQQQKLSDWALVSSNEQVQHVLKSIVEEFHIIHERLTTKLRVIEDQEYVYRILARAKQFGSIKQAI